MEKKFYEAPEVEVMNLEIENCLLAGTVGGNEGSPKFNDPDTPAPEDDY